MLVKVATLYVDNGALISVLSGFRLDVTAVRAGTQDDTDCARRSPRLLLVSAGQQGSNLHGSTRGTQFKDIFRRRIARIQQLIR